MQTVIKIIIAFFFSQNPINQNVDSQIKNSTSIIEKNELGDKIIIVDCFVPVDEKTAYY